MPNEPAECGFKHKIRQTAYPTREAAGVIWAYMGPQATMPDLPQLELTLVPESHVYVHKRFQHCNYLQNVEGEVDSSHVSFLHGSFGQSSKQQLPAKRCSAVQRIWSQNFWSKKRSTG